MSANMIGAIASFMSAAFAGFGLIGLWLYVRYTKQMMESTDAAFRANIEPLLVPDIGPKSFEDFLNQKQFMLQVSNEGNGPALQASYVQFNDKASIEQFGTFREFPNELGRDALGTIRSKLPPEQFTEIKLNSPKIGESTLIVLSYRDSANTWHQCQIKYTQTSQMEWLTTILYCRKSSQFTMSRYSYPPKELES